MSKVLLVGCGKMGSALLQGWLDRGQKPTEICVVEPDPAAQAAFPDVRVVATAAEIPRTFLPHVVVLAVKPQMMDQVLPAYGEFGGAAYLSIAAGKTINYFKGMMGTTAVVVRAMPNTPSAVRRGITAMVASPNTKDRHRGLCQALLEAVGPVIWLDDEAQMDAVTAVSGSGPAYVFLMVESLAAAGVAAGLPPAMAMTLARATVAGSGELLHLSPEAAGVLRQNVTSPGGTTAAALQVLMAKDGLPALMGRAVAAAAQRSKELAG